MKKPITLLIMPLLLALPGTLSGADAVAQKSPLYQAPDVLTAPGDMAAVIKSAGRAWQGASPGIARTKGGRLFACLMSGGKREPEPPNYAIYMVSDDDGKTWLDPFLIINHPHPEMRITAPSLWVDPLGRLWIYWNHHYPFQGPGHRGIWAIRVDNPDAPIEDVCRQIHAFAPVRQFDGFRINKPIVNTQGDWLQPISLARNKHILVIASSDQGATWGIRGIINIPKPAIEPMMVEKQDGKLWLLARLFTKMDTPFDNGVGQSFSTDGGFTWTELKGKIPHPLTGPSSRFYIGRLQSGALLFINNDDFKLRRKLTAFLSTDDGATWPHALVLDNRVGRNGSYASGPSYPDCVQAPDGRIYVVWDFCRYDDKEMRLSIFTEADIKAGAFVSPAARDKLVVSRAGL